MGSIKKGAVTGILFFFFVCSLRAQPRELYPILHNYAQELYAAYKTIPENRRFRLEAIAEYIREKKMMNKQAEVLFIGTNQSTRSLMVQAWAKAAAYYYGFDGGEYFSGGIHEGPVSTKTIQALERAGFIVYKIEEGNKEYYRVKYSYNLKPLVLYPKKIDDRLNPPANYMAVIVCPNAAQNLPVVPGTYNRIELIYNDPLGFEGTEEEKARYDRVCRQIALEMFYLFSKLKHV